MDEPKNSKAEVNTNMITGLLQEREGLVQRAGARDDELKAHLKGRIGQVDEQIKLRGGKPPQGATPAAQRGQQTRGKKAEGEGDGTGGGE